MMRKTTLLGAACVSIVMAMPAFAQRADRPQARPHAADDSFLYAPVTGGGRPANYIADSHKGQPFDGNDRRRFDRPYLAGENTGLKLPTR